MSKCLIHIGTTKTGSSVIQFSQLKAKNKNVYYPRLSGINHEMISVAFDEYKYWPNTYKRPYRNKSKEEINKHQKKIKKRFLKQIRGKRKIIISGEHLVEMSSEGVYKLKHDLMKQGFTEFLVLLYIRDPASHYLSLMQQKIKFSTTNIISPENYFFPYSQYIKTWESIFPESLLVREFNRKRLVGNDILSDFTYVASDFFNQNLESFATKEKNESLTVEQIVVLQKFRKNTYPGRNDNVTRLTRSIKFYIMNYIFELIEKGTKIELKNEVIRILLSSHDNEITYLANNWGIKFSEFEKKAIETEPYTVDVSDFRTVVKNCDNKLVEAIEYRLMADFLKLKHRKMLNPIFNKMFLRRYLGIFREYNISD